VLQGLLTQHRQLRGGGQQRDIYATPSRPEDTTPPKPSTPQDGAIRCAEAEAADRCRAALDEGVEAVFTGVTPGYRLVKTASDVEDLLEEGVLRPAGVRRRRGGLRLREEDCTYGPETVQEVPRDV